MKLIMQIKLDIVEDQRGKHNFELGEDAPDTKRLDDDDDDLPPSIF